MLNYIVFTICYIGYRLFFSNVKIILPRLLRSLPPLDAEDSDTLLCVLRLLWYEVSNTHSHGVDLDPPLGTCLLTEAYPDHGRGRYNSGSSAGQLHLTLLIRLSSHI